MFEQLFGLPAHPLLVHAPVVLAPLAAVLALVYAVVPPLRRHLGWLLAVVAVAAAGAAWVAVESGEALARTLGGSPEIERHERLGETFRTYVILLASVAVLLVVVDVSRRRRRRGGAPATAHGDVPVDGAAARRPRGLGAAVSVLLSVGMVVVAVATVVYAVRAGHSGAEMVWGS